MILGHALLLKNFIKRSPPTPPSKIVEFTILLKCEILRNFPNFSTYFSHTDIITYVML